MSSIALILESCLKRTNAFFRFLLVGAVNTLTGLSVMLLLLNTAGQSYWLSTFTGNCAGAVVSYFLNRSFTFQSKVNVRKSVFYFIAVIVACYFFSYTISNTMADIIMDYCFFCRKLSHEELAVFIGIGIYTNTNYFGQKYFVFKAK